MSFVVWFCFILMALFALASAATGALMVLGIADRHWAWRLVQKLFLAEAIAFFILGCFALLGTGA